MTTLNSFSKCFQMKNCQHDHDLWIQDEVFFFFIFFVRVTFSDAGWSKKLKYKKREKLKTLMPLCNTETKSGSWGEVSLGQTAPTQTCFLPTYWFVTPSMICVRVLELFPPSLSHFLIPGPWGSYITACLIIWKHFTFHLAPPSCSGGVEHHSISVCTALHTLAVNDLCFCREGKKISFQHIWDSL